MFMFTMLLYRVYLVVGGVNFCSLCLLPLLVVVAFLVSTIAKWIKQNYESMILVIMQSIATFELICCGRQGKKKILFFALHNCL